MICRDQRKEYNNLSAKKGGNVKDTDGKMKKRSCRNFDFQEETD